MTLKLFYSPGACSLAAHIVLRELDEPFSLEQVVIAKGQHLDAAYLKINPRGRIPTLLVDGEPIRELSAILTWLGQRNGRLYPKAGTLDAAKCAEWLAWLTSSLHITFAMIWRGQRFAKHEHEHLAIRRHGLTVLREQFAEIEAALKGKEFLVADRYTVADPNLFVFYRWGWRMGFDMRKDYPNWSAHSDRLLARGAVIEALKVEDIPAQPPSSDPVVANAASGEMTTERLAAFGDAWARADVETLLSMMDDDGIYAASVGSDPGETFRGAEQLRAGFQKLLDLDKDGRRTSGPVWIFGDMGVGLWSFEFRAQEGRPAANVLGIDLFEFKNGKILKKDAFRKTTASRP